MSEQDSYIPLAERMRPRKLSDVLGQDHLLGPGASFGEILRSGHFVPSVIFCGPPGIGKTTLAQIIADVSHYHFSRLSGVLDGVADIRRVIQEAQERRLSTGRPTLVLVDEIHRFNRIQQDAFLPHVECGLISIIGQTTENVSFRIRGALLSRLRVLMLRALSESDLALLVERALADVDCGLGEENLKIDEGALRELTKFSSGDARRLLNGLEWAALRRKALGGGTISLEDIIEGYGSQPQYYDQAGDYHYDCVSALIKSMRGSDPDAALYYLVRALECGEDPQFITRRMIIFASEDTSCDPRALQIAVDVDRAVERVGLPEARINLAQAVVYLACAAKSNASYVALCTMEKIVAEHPGLAIPLKLCNAPTDMMKESGRSLGYHYPHDYPGGFVPERYLPPELGDLLVYHPTDRGIDAAIKEKLDRLRSLVRK